MKENFCCPDVFEDFIEDCPDIITVYANLEPGLEVRWILQDPMGNYYESTTTVGDDGSFEINPDELPIGLFSTCGGKFCLKVENAQTGAPLPLLIGSYYQEIVFSVTQGYQGDDSLGDKPFIETEVSTP